MTNDDESAAAGTVATTEYRAGPDSAESASQPPKRRRIALACSACRIRKSRCNGVRPRCEPCERLGFECIYELPETSANLLVPKDLFTALEDRVRLLETVVKQHGDRLAVVENDQPKNSGPRPGITLEPRLNVPGTVVVNVEGNQDLPTDHSLTDGMAISFVDEQDCGFFGPSSNIAFMRHIFRAMTRRSKALHDGLSPLSASNIGLYEAGIISVSRPISPTIPTLTTIHPTGQVAETGANLLPPHCETEKLIRAYFSNTGLLFPFIHQESFLAVYESMKSQNFRTNVRRVWLGLLNMILAMAVCTTGWAEDATEYRLEQSDVFYRRARELCKTQMLRGTTLETVQYLLLTSQYLQGTQKSVQTWTTHGLAVKAALSIGLHSADAMAKFPPIEQEMRKRTWFGCILLDRSLSMTFGRPSAIPEDYVKIDHPTPIPSCDGQLSATESISVAFFNATIHLYRVMWKIMATLYGHNLGCNESPSETSMITQIFQLEQELVDWQNSLPPPLFLRSSSNLPMEGDAEDVIIERFRLILSLRYLNVQLLLHRPSLVKSLGDFSMEASASSRQGKTVNQMQVNFNRTCVRVAEDIIEIIHAVLTRPCLGRQLIGAWWFTLYYTFNAALAIFGSLLLPSDDTLGEAVSMLGHRDRRKRFLEKAIEALTKLDTQNAVLNRCIDYLRQLSGLITTWTSSSPRTIQFNGPSPAGLQNEHLELDALQGGGEVNPELLAGMPLLFEKSATGFEDELELGHFFATEFQRWFERFPT